MPISILCRVTLLLFCLSYTSGCATLERWDDSVYVDESVSSLRQNIVKTAKNQLGAKYKYAAKGPNSFDCSGLVSYVHQKNHLATIGSSQHLSQKGNGIPMMSAQPGDLIFYKKNNKVFHVSIISKVASTALWVIHSTSSKGVIEEDIMASTYWEPKVYKIISLDAYTN